MTGLTFQTMRVRAVQARFNRALLLVTVSPFALLRPVEGWAPRIRMAEKKVGDFKRVKGKEGLYDYNP